MRFCEPFDTAFFVLSYPALKIVGHANIERAILFGLFGPPESCSRDSRNRYMHFLGFEPDGSASKLTLESKELRPEYLILSLPYSQQGSTLKNQK